MDHIIVWIAHTVALLRVNPGHCGKESYLRGIRENKGENQEFLPRNNDFDPVYLTSIWLLPTKSIAIS